MKISMHMPFRALSKRVWLVIGIVTTGVVILVAHQFMRTSQPTTATQQASVSHVHVATVAALSSGAVGPLSVTGKIMSLSRATILAQISGEITTLSHSIGDRVDAGAVIAQFDNRSQQAAVLQAQGAYDAAVAVAAKAGGSTLENARAAVLAALSSAAAALDDAVTVRADALFTNPRTDAPALVLTVPDSALAAQLKSERVALDATLADAHTVAGDQSADPDTAATAMQGDLSAALTFLNDLLQAVNETPPSQQTSATTLAAYQTSLAAARSEVVAAVTGVTNAKSAYDSNDPAAAQASVTQAQGALDAAKAALEKTIIRSPIAGTIVSLPITQGGYVSAYAPVVTVSNPGALYVDVQVTPEDARSIVVGGVAIINGSVHGTITFIAPAIDPTTGKIEVKVGVTDAAHVLVDGEVVSVSLSRTVGHVGTVEASGASTVTLPIVALKMLPSGPVVFTVQASSSTLIAHTVTLGSILGSQVVIVSGVTPAMSIVTDARGLAEGQTVVVDTP